MSKLRGCFSPALSLDLIRLSDHNLIRQDKNFHLTVGCFAENSPNSVMWWSTYPPQTLLGNPSKLISTNEVALSGRRAPDRSLGTFSLYFPLSDSKRLDSLDGRSRGSSTKASTFIAHLHPRQGQLGMQRHLQEPGRAPEAPGPEVISPLYISQMCGFDCPPKYSLLVAYKVQV